MEHEEERNLTQSKHTQESLELQNQLQDSETTRQALQQEVTELRERIDSIRQVRHRMQSQNVKVQPLVFLFHCSTDCDHDDPICFMLYKGAILLKLCVLQEFIVQDMDMHSCRTPYLLFCVLLSNTIKIYAIIQEHTMDNDFLKELQQRYDRDMNTLEEEYRKTKQLYQTVRTTLILSSVVSCGAQCLKLLFS